MNFLDLSSVLGLVATCALTLNMLLGMLIGVTYRRHKLWQHLPERLRRIRIFHLHNWTAYLALLLVLLHPLLLLADPATKFSFLDIVFPIYAPHQKLFVAAGTVAMFAVIAVVLTSQKAVRRKMKYRLWKNIHLLSYGTALLFIVHGIVLDPLLKDRPVDPFDAEKLVSELCGLVLLVAAYLRYRYHVQARKGKIGVKG